ncbi:MAG: adenylosuccinate lyase, partial [Elusimicrobiota bacterium]|nr:adenylosuccinate lyase [Elusimicrobiota bacterium]
LKKGKELLKNCLTISEKYKDLIMIGRTHGIHAEPITFGVKILSWYSEISRHIEMIESTLKHVSYGKISGVVGTYAHLEPKIEEFVCSKLGLEPEPISTQIIPRDRYAVYLCHLAIVASSIEKFVTELRNLQRTEICELEEGFTAGQKGSSAMPHKKNPITSEQLTGLARVIRANCLASFENVALWHERDISHSSVERIILPDSSILLDYILHRFNNLLQNLVVYPKNMLANIEKSNEVYFSQALMLALIKKGLTRQKAYHQVQKLSQEALLTGEKFKDIILKDKFIVKFLSKQEIKKIFNLSYFTKNIDKIYNRLKL